MNTTKLLLKICAPVILSVAGCSLLSSCDSSGDFKPNSGVPGANLDAVAKPITDTRILDYIEFETASGTSAFRYLNFDTAVSGFLSDSIRTAQDGQVLVPTEEALENRQVVNVLFNYVTKNSNTFAIEGVTAGIYETQFRDHVLGIYGSAQYGFNSITRAITLNRTGSDFDLAEVLAIADEFNGYLPTINGTNADSVGNILDVHLPSGTLYSPAYEEYVFVITSDNSDRLAGIVRGNFARRVYGREIGWRRPNASEVGDAGSLRLDPGHLVPFISNKIINLGIAENGTFELTLVAGNAAL